MERQFGGAVVVILSLLCVLVLTTFVAPPRAGTPVRSPTLIPPDVGSCGMTIRARFVVRDCADPHTAEVVSTWRPGDPELELPTFGVCAGRAQLYVGSPPAHDAAAHPLGEWSLPLRYRQLAIAGPAGTSLSDWSWRLCLVVPIGPAPWQGYTGTVRSMSPSGSRPTALRPCLANNTDDLAVVSCTTPHGGEVVATQRAPLTDAGGAVPMESCVAAAAKFTGNTDPTFAGALRVDVWPRPGVPWVAPLSADTGVFYTSDAGSDWLICVVESAGESRLLDSVAGIGAGPLPWE